MVCLVISSFMLASGNDVFRTRTIKKTMLKAAKWQLANPKHDLHDWTNGALYAGIMEAYKATGAKSLYKAMISMGNENNWTPGKRLQHADDYAIGQTYIDLYRLTNDPKMIKALKDSLDKFVSIPYKTEDIRKTTWWWCDALFMMPPTLVKMGVTLKNPRYLQVSDSLFHATYDLLYNKQEHLFARDLRYVWQTGGENLKESNGKKIFWSRGNGWVLGGLVRVLSELPKDYADRDFYINLYKQMAERVAGLQMEDGLWRASMLDPEAYPGGEASGSGFFCYALAWGIDNNILSANQYLPVVKKAWTALNGLVHDNGMVGWVQPIGADPRKNFSADSWEVYGTGAFLLAGSEVLKLAEDNKLQ